MDHACHGQDRLYRCWASDTRNAMGRARQVRAPSPSVWNKSLDHHNEQESATKQHQRWHRDLQQGLQSQRQ